MTRPSNVGALRAMAQALTDETLAQRLDMILANRRSFDKQATDEMLREATRRLRWGRKNESFPRSPLGVAAMYRVVRFYRDERPRKVVKTGLTLEQAQAHCDDESTRDDGWFDGYERETDEGGQGTGRGEQQ